MIDMDTSTIMNVIKDKSLKDFPTELFKDEEVNVVKYLEKLLSDKGTPVKKLIDRLGYDRSYTYQMFNGTRTPTRVFVLRLAFVLGLDYEETQRTLYVTGNRLLYAKIQFDAAIIFAIMRNYCPEQLEELLENLGEASLFWNNKT